ncbi:aminotransferase class I/II-fold pyridoxal phosphate-dependent enzyme [Candidatus Micrarchaeota archaeon]|nr:aminotransferase class I/II-fold pyridoxal phosphate-dependent enzyme [Candidatus Micrarchaeota archaeon]
MQRAGVAAFRGPKTHVNAFNSELKKRRDLLVKRIDGIDGLSMVAPKGAFYAYVKIEDMKEHKNDWSFVRALLKEGVVVVPGSGFSSVLPPTYFRIVFLPSLEQLNGAMDRIEKFFKK